MSPERSRRPGRAPRHRRSNARGGKRGSQPAMELASETREGHVERNLSWPESSSRAARAKISNVTMSRRGFPAGRRRTARARDRRQRLAGLNEHAVETRIRRAQSGEHGSTMSYCRGDAAGSSRRSGVEPPLDSSRGCARGCRAPPAGFADAATARATLRGQRVRWSCESGIVGDRWHVDDFIARGDDGRPPASERP